MGGGRSLKQAVYLARRHKGGVPRSVAAGSELVLAGLPRRALQEHRKHESDNKTSQSRDRSDLKESETGVVCGQRRTKLGLATFNISNIL